MQAYQKKAYALDESSSIFDFPFLEKVIFDLFREHITLMDIHDVDRCKPLLRELIQPLEFG